DITLTGGIDLTAADTGVKGAATVHLSLTDPNDPNPNNRGLFDASISGSFSARFAGINLFRVTPRASLHGPPRPTRTPTINVQGTGWFLEWVTEIVEMLESAAKAAGYAIKDFLEGVGCEIASWFGSDCKDRKVKAEVRKQENQQEHKGFSIDIITFRLPN